MKLKIYLLGLSSLFLIKVIIAFLYLPLLGRMDKFPFSTYEMFSSVYKTTSILTVYLEEVDGTRFDPPILIYDYLDGDRDVVFVRFFDRIDLTSRKNILDIKQVQEDVKPLFVKNSKVKYHLYRLEVDKWEFYKTGSIVKAEKLGTFTYEH